MLKKEKKKTFSILSVGNGLLIEIKHKYHTQCRILIVPRMNTFLKLF